MHIAVAFLHMHANAHHMHVYVFNLVNLSNRSFVYPQRSANDDKVHLMSSYFHYSKYYSVLAWSAMFCPLALVIFGFYLYFCFCMSFALLNASRWHQGKSEWSLGKKCLWCLKVLNTFPLILVLFSVLASFSRFCFCFALFAPFSCFVGFCWLLTIMCSFRFIMPSVLDFLCLTCSYCVCERNRGLWWFVCVCLAPGEFAQTCYTLQIASQTWHRVFYLGYARC